VGVDPPLVIEPEALEAELGAPDLLVVDLCQAPTYAQAHVPGAVHLEYGAIVASRPPAGGLLPEAEALGRVLGGIGIVPERRVVAYDDEGGGKAARLLWTLDVLGHPRHALLNGGLHAWAGAGLPLEHTHASPSPGAWSPTPGEQARAGKDYILAHLEDPAVVLVDARSAAEYRGVDRRAQRGGHIPGAVHVDWMEAIDRSRELRLKPAPELRALFEAQGVTPDKEAITYCQTHHRSSHTYVVLRTLGYPRVRGYPGAWSEWGNLPDTPVET